MYEVPVEEVEQLSAIIREVHRVTEGESGNQNLKGLENDSKGSDFCPR